MAYKYLNVSQILFSLNSRAMKLAIFFIFLAVIASFCVSADTTGDDDLTRRSHRHRHRGRPNCKTSKRNNQMSENESGPDDTNGFDGPDTQGMGMSRKKREETETVQPKFATEGPAIAAEPTFLTAEPPNLVTDPRSVSTEPSVLAEEPSLIVNSTAEDTGPLTWLKSIWD